MILFGYVTMIPLLISQVYLRRIMQIFWVKNDVSSSLDQNVDVDVYPVLYIFSSQKVLANDFEWNIPIQSFIYMVL